MGSAALAIWCKSISRATPTESGQKVPSKILRKWTDGICFQKNMDELPALKSESRGLTRLGIRRFGMGPAALAKMRRDTAMKTPTESEQKSINEYSKKWSFLKFNGICFTLKI